MSQPLRWCFLGRKPYGETLALQLALREQVRGGGPDTLLLVEHPPVITLGRSADQTNVIWSKAQLEEEGVEVHQITRGGDVTYHGPGQLVGYPIRSVGRKVREHVDAMIGAITAYLRGLEIECAWDAGNPGVWTSRGKIAAIGVDARGGVTLHGFALNVATRLDDFKMIVPCGLNKPVTSIADFREPAPSLSDAGEALAEGLGQRFSRRLERITPEQVLL